MSGTLKLDYYYGAEAEQFSFYRIPRLLIKDEQFRELSTDAKLLYGLMLDRLSLSVKNNWLDDQNRAYIIYTVDAIMEDLSCGKEKAIKVLAELDTKKGIGLIERIRRGLGRPDIIYVKNFVISKEKKELSVGMGAATADEFAEDGKADLQRSEKPTSRSGNFGLQQVGKSDFRKSENRTLRSGHFSPPKVGNSNPNYTDYSQTEQSYNYHIDQSGSMPEKTMDERDAYIEIIKENIEYDHYMQYSECQDRELFNELFEIICEIVCTQQKTVKIGGNDYPYELVKSKFLKLNRSHLEYVIECMQNTSSNIKNIKAYLITALFNAPNTIKHYYQQEVQHDLYGNKKDAARPLLDTVSRSGQCGY